jgi:hypothetical protein
MLVSIFRLATPPASRLTPPDESRAQITRQCDAAKADWREGPKNADRRAACAAADAPVILDESGHAGYGHPEVS